MIKRAISCVVATGVFLSVSNPTNADEPAPVKSESHSSVQISGTSTSSSVDPLLRDAQLNVAEADDLGLCTTPATELLLSMCKLKNGLIVDVVVPNSPAQLAGVSQLDVLEKLNDQLLINSAQLTALLRMQKAGDRVTLTVVRDGKRKTLTVTLKDRPRIESHAPTQTTSTSSGTFVDGTRTAKTASPLSATNSTIVLNLVAEPEKKGVRAGTIIAQPAPGNDKTDDLMCTGKTKSGFAWVIKSRAGHCLLKVTDTKTGKAIFDGPIDSPKQRSPLSKEILEELQKTGKFIREMENKYPLQSEIKEWYDPVLKAIGPQ